VSVTHAAVFAALDYCDKANKANQDADNLRAQITTYLDDLNNAQVQLEQARKENENLSNQVRNLQAKLASK
ncbi:MAG: cell division protein ZapA, partial [Clostridiales bacterium]|nr:cell division protein ZapA [Clostridiales bacterium]